MRYTATGVTVGLGALTLASQLGGGHASAGKQIQACYNRANAALARRDIDGFFANVANNATFVDTSGRTMRAADYRAWLKNNMVAGTSARVATRIEAISVTGSRATVTTREVKRLGMPNARIGGSVSVVYEAVHRDKWVNGAGGWKLQQMTTVRQTQTVNGTRIQ